MVSGYHLKINAAVPCYTRRGDKGSDIKGPVAAEAAEKWPRNRKFGINDNMR
jgi:ribosomal protein L14